MRIDVRGKTVLTVMRRSEARPLLFDATTKCRECGAECTIAPASIERLRAEPEIIVLCVECTLEHHKIEPFESFSLVSAPELIEALARMRRRS